MARRSLEHSLQVAVAHMLNVVLDPERTWWTSIDHGVGKLGFKEAGIRKARGVKPGIPDIIIMWGDAYLIGIELKAGKGALSEAQVDVAAAWSIFGNTVFVARSLEEVQSILIECAIPMRRRMNFFSGGGKDERRQRPAKARHRSPPRQRKSKGYLPLVFTPAAQKN